MVTRRLDLPVWVLASLGLLVLCMFVGIRFFGPDYVAVPYTADLVNRDQLKAMLRSRGIPFIVTESEIWIPRQELNHLRLDSAPPA